MCGHPAQLRAFSCITAFCYPYPYATTPHARALFRIHYEGCQVWSGLCWGHFGGGYTPRDGASRWGAVRPSRLSHALEPRTWASQIFCTSLGPYLCAPQVAGTVAVGSSGRPSRSEHRRGTAGQSAARPVLRRDRCWNAEPGRVYAPANKIRRDLISCNGLRRWFPSRNR